ncbi:formate dehydrogenase subunit gamma [Lutimaribacter marinistellae]|uniref:Formate dehydrogenase subunit gamma n=1 Tax=Lutimaribacter marinistellae TaxID=1820329 RepID=A0ABV7TQL2_9RHOB
MTMLRLLICLFCLALPAVAQETPELPPIDRSATGGATTLEDILRRQEGLKVDDSYRSENLGQTNREGTAAGLSTRGVASDADIFRALRYNAADVTTSSRGPAADVIIQDGGMRWLLLREGPIRKYGTWILGGMLVLLAVFFLIRGRIRIDGEKTGRTVTRFSGFERFGHWLFAGSFLILGATGLITLWGRQLFMPLVGKEGYATLAQACKWLHNNIAWAFILGLVIVTVNWIAHNIPSRLDLKWLAAGGGLFSKGHHPPARKFNAGQKIIFWACIVLGVSISLSGLSLLFPFEMPMFAKTFVVINDIGVLGWFGYAPLPEVLAPHEEMQYAQLWHVIVAFIFIAIILAHIYLGSIGMEGAFDAMGNGEVEEQWAREHHSLWLEEVKESEAQTGGKAPSPAE